MLKSFSANVTFIKVIDSVAGKSEVLDFIDSLKTFGKLRHKNDNENEFPYFPSKAIVIARDYSPTLMDELEKLPRFSNKAAIPGTHISPDAGMMGAPSAMKCFIEVWKWNDSGYPERIFN
jgi:hypothetical protein